MNKMFKYLNIAIVSVQLDEISFNVNVVTGGGSGSGSGSVACSMDVAGERILLSDTGARVTHGLV